MLEIKPTHKPIKEYFVELERILAHGHDKRSGITNDPNREDDPTYIVRLIKKVVTVSVETVKVVGRSKEQK